MRRFLCPEEGDVYKNKYDQKHRSLAVETMVLTQLGLTTLGPKGTSEKPNFYLKYARTLNNYWTSLLTNLNNSASSKAAELDVNYDIEELLEEKPITASEIATAFGISPHALTKEQKMTFYFRVMFFSSDPRRRLKRGDTAGLEKQLLFREIQAMNQTRFSEVDQAALLLIDSTTPLVYKKEKGLVPLGKFIAKVLTPPTKHTLSAQ